MNTPLDDWRDTPEDQLALFKFMNSAVGQRFIRVLEFLGRPNASAIPATGTEAAIQGGLLYQQSAGHFALLDQIPKLYPDAIVSAKKQADATLKVSKGKTLQPVPKV